MKDILKKNHFNVKHLYITTLDVGRPYWVLYICTPVVRIDQRAHEHRGDDAAYQARPVHHLPQGSRQFKKKFGGGGVNPLSFTLESLETFFDTYFSDNFFFIHFDNFSFSQGEGAEAGDKHFFPIDFQSYREDANKDVETGKLRETTSFFLAGYFFPGCDKEGYTLPHKMVRDGYTTSFRY